MQTTIDYTCKFCGTPRTFTSDVPDDCPPLELPKWKSLLVCDRCADYERSKRDTQYAIRQQLAALKTIRYGVKNADRLAQLEQNCRLNLNDLTKKLFELVCDHFHKPPAWEPEITEYLMSQPDKSYGVLNRFKRLIGLPECVQL